MRLVHEAEAGSSNDRVLEIAIAADECDPVALRVDRQSAGRGRLGRSWHGPGGGVWLSVAWPCVCEAALYEPAPVLAGLAVHSVLGDWLASIGRAAEAVHLKVKWPNDVLVDDRKLAGVLCERPGVDGGRWLVVGVGLNIETPAGVQGVERAIGLGEAFGDAPFVAALAEQIATAIGLGLSALESEAASAIADARAALEPVLAYRGEVVRLAIVGRSDRNIEGVVVGVDAGLRLLVADGDGLVTACSAGEIERLRPIDDRGVSGR
jgi:BirA family biotin operon repressor/biotin-[acetyl-CoA-carboxylase] ligase